MRYAERVVLSHSSENHFRRWAIRAIAAFLVVYMLGSFGIPTLVFYVAVMLAVTVDGLRLAMQRRRPETDTDRKQSRTETIH
jgi:hypothetical protein